ncbi:hypothetical protein CONLIGDRAFT_501143 [Coniochaeta ligniaria NRRL 30616]|uniref:Uncharacterized protein n=1 Tax=Coniochaeta ligniaria NRRL 30616 TaxID=1408157 RepID=A0A1J7IWZ5_9PEZI|nr:hypothetical protein CONLIGDRAFT_501143 [Coniochaeta ligniaria NRRL 30616]
MPYHLLEPGLRIGKPTAASTPPRSRPHGPFRAYTDPFNTSNPSSLTPPSIPPPPPPPPPLNVPPSRARLQLAARLAMHKNKAASEAAAATSTSPPEGGDATGAGASAEGSAADSNGSSSSSFTLLQAAPELTRERDLPDREPRDPFADDEEDDSGSGSGSDGEGEGSPATERSAGSASGWHRGGWWRGVVRSARGRSGRGAETGHTATAADERFGDGRDDDSDDSEGEGEDVGDDEEFGDFAMPEVAAADGAAGAGAGAEGKAEGGVEREKEVLKPLPLHPAPGRSSASPFGSLWPFSSQGFGGITGGAKEKEKERDEGVKGKEAGEPEITEEPLELGGEAGEGEGVLDEDGKKVERAVEATRRTSIEDPDDEEAEEVVVGRRGRG